MDNKKKLNFKEKWRLNKEKIKEFKVEFVLKPLNLNNYSNETQQIEYIWNYVNLLIENKIKLNQSNYYIFSDINFQYNRIKLLLIKEDFDYINNIDDLNFLYLILELILFIFISPDIENKVFDVIKLLFEINLKKEYEIFTNILLKSKSIDYTKLNQFIETLYQSDNEDENKNKKNNKKKQTMKMGKKIKNKNKKKKKVKIDFSKNSNFENLLNNYMKNFDNKEKQTWNIVFIGHVDAGKSTLIGRLMINNGMVDDHSLKKLKLEAKEKAGESWYLSYLLDFYEEEKKKGKTMEIVNQNFETENKKFIFWDSPGHENYLINMIKGCYLADFIFLIVSAVDGEFELSISKKGQIFYQTLLAKKLGCNKIVCIINKMDTIKWDFERFNFIKNKIDDILTNDLKFKKNNIKIIPISAYMDHNINTNFDKKISNNNLFEILNNLEKDADNNKNEMLRICIIDKYKSGFEYIYGKLESGLLIKNMEVIILPIKKKVKVKSIFDWEDKEINIMKLGECCKIVFYENIFDDIKVGNVISSINDMPYIVNEIEVKLKIINLKENEIFSNGCKMIIHIHSSIEEVKVTKIVKNYTNPLLSKKMLKIGDKGKVRLKSNNLLIIEKYIKLKNMGKFVLRKNNNTVSYGKIIRLKPIKENNDGSVDIDNIDLLDMNKINDNNMLYNSEGEDI